MHSTEKMEDTMPRQPDKPQLRQTMRLRETVALGIGGTIGGAIFILVGTAIDQAGLGALLSFGLAFLAAVMIALPYAELACRYPLAGGGYAFVQAILGRFSGFVMGWVYAGSWLFISGYVTLGFGSYLRVLFGIPPLTGALALIAGIVVMNLMGGHLFSRVQIIIVLLAVTALVGYVVMGLPHIHPSQLPFLPHKFNGILEVTPLAFLALAGFEMVATAGEEVEHPQRTLPLAILLTLGIVLMLYLFVTFVTAGTVPSATLRTSLSPLSEAATRFLGATGGRLVAMAAAMTTAATANAVLVATSRITFAMARDGLLPRWFAQVHSSTKAPWLAILVNGGILVLMALTGAAAATEAVHLLAGVGSFLYVLQFVLPLIALVVLRRRDKTAPAFHTPVPGLVLPLAFGGCSLLLIGCLLLLNANNQWGIIVGCSWVTAGVVAYAGVRNLSFFVRRRIYLHKKGYAATVKEIAAQRTYIDHLLQEPHFSFEQILAMQALIEELKQLRAIQAWLEQQEQLRAAHTRIEELRHLRGTQVRVEELELLRVAHARIEEHRLRRATQARTEEFKCLQSIQIQPTLGEVLQEEQQRRQKQIELSHRPIQTEPNDKDIINKREAAKPRAHPSNGSKQSDKTA